MTEPDDKSPIDSVESGPSPDEVLGSKEDNALSLLDVADVAAALRGVARELGMPVSDDVRESPDTFNDNQSS